MFKTLWFLFIALMISAAVIWLLDHNGSVIIYWLGYEAKTDILTVILLIIFFAFLTFIFSYFVARILAIKISDKIPHFFKKDKKS
ncbi:MAG: hypothetical protein SFV53_04210 [Rickettsiales bacterium]|nr:hypothetical protein [Rickettsiales bacterium]